MFLRKRSLLIALVIVLYRWFAGLNMDDPIS
jgi:hypothetical protein